MLDCFNRHDTVEVIELVSRDLIAELRALLLVVNETVDALAAVLDEIVFMGVVARLTVPVPEVNCSTEVVVALAQLSMSSHLVEVEDILQGLSGSYCEHERSEVGRRPDRRMLVDNQLVQAVDQIVILLKQIVQLCGAELRLLGKVVRDAVHHAHSRDDDLGSVSVVGNIRSQHNKYCRCGNRINHAD